MNRPNHQRGFVLITSLIFLVVVTLLAVSAINNSTLQEKIAANMRAQKTAELHANAALREAEALLASAQDFETYHPVGKTVTVDPIPSGLETKGPIKVHVWQQGGMLISPTTNSTLAEKFVNPNTWTEHTPTEYTITAVDGSDDTLAHYYIEELDGCYQADLNPDACATGRVVIYRITARAQYGKATVVTQSTFEKYY